MAGLKQHPGVKHRRVDITTPPNTAIAAPQTTTLGLTSNLMVDTVTVQIPGGHAGLTGLRVVIDGKTLLPWTVGSERWLIGDDLYETYELGFPTGHNLDFVTYNLDDTFPHTHYLKLATRDLVDLVEYYAPDQIDAEPVY